VLTNFSGIILQPQAFFLQGLGKVTTTSKTVKIVSEEKTIT